MIISIDYDDTFTSDPSAFLEVIDILKEHGHYILCISARLDNERNQLQLKKALPRYVKILLTGGQAKRDYAKSKGHEVDIWIDDLPQDIVNDKVWQNKPK